MVRFGRMKVKGNRFFIIGFYILNSMSNPQINELNTLEPYGINRKVAKKRVIKLSMTEQA